MAAVATRSSTTANSPHLNTKSQTSSPRSNRNSLQAPDTLKTEPSEKPETSVPTIKQPEAEAESKDTAAAPANAPLAPPPKPSQNGDGDYFGASHNGSHLTKEPNPFESAFGNPAETPGKTQLPGVTSLTSPASLLPGNTPGWPGSLRSGPLSPAMLTGPTGSNDYFSSDHHFPGSFPTPNESSLRTGLTPGGGGSMFPQPSPNSQALYNSLQSGGATPGTLDFHRTAMNARTQNSQNTYGLGQSATSQAQQNPNIQPDLDSKPYNPNGQGAQQDNQDPFGSHQSNEAANGLFMLAQAGGQQQQQQRNATSYPMSQQGYQPGMQQDQRNKGSIGSNLSGSTEHADQYSEEDSKANLRGARGKKGAAGKGAANGKRKNEEGTGKQAANKKARASTQSEEPEDMDDMSPEAEEMGKDGKKMTDEEKRKNFLERNRVAALKCRQRKKQWLANLQQKVEIFSTENDALAATVTQLREEIVGLKTLLLAHKDCPVSQAQGISGMAMQQIAGDTQHYANPYGMAMGQGGPGMGQGQMAQAQMQRR
ncbi:putative transcription factor Jun, basic-leucine zipper domain-containing protein [Septoria linicola]|nr:putative transcription factor Jun, basic-leucine zipper domain-containing protein [Septoria linicola]